MLILMSFCSTLDHSPIFSRKRRQHWAMEYVPIVSPQTFKTFPIDFIGGLCLLFSCFAMKEEGGTADVPSSAAFSVFLCVYDGLTLNKPSDLLSHQIGPSYM